MSRARDKGEQDLLRKLRSDKSTASVDGKECGSLSCPSLGIVQPASDFYKRRGGKLDSYCILCRRARSAMWKFDNPGHSGTGRKTQNTSWEPNLGKASWCKEHKVNSAKCGCAMGRFYKSLAHKKKIAVAMKGKKNATGNRGNRKPRSADHKFRISMAVKETLRKKRETI